MSVFLSECGALFLHIPRTGGTWITKSLYLANIPYEWWHDVGEGSYRNSKHTIIPHLRKDLWSRVRLVFAFVRHPVPYYVSVWRFNASLWKRKPRTMQRLVGRRSDPRIISQAELRFKPDFSEWLDEMLEEEPAWATRWFEMYVGPERGEFCHFIGRTETLEDDMTQLMQMLGYEKLWTDSKEKRSQITVARNRIRERQVPEIKLTDDQRERIEKSERVLIRRFYGEGTINKRLYRDFSSGEPL